MELSTFVSGSRSQGGPVKTYYNKVKNFLYPPTKERNKERMGQYKDLAIFAGSIIMVCIFEERIKGFLEIETDEIKKLTQGTL